MSEAGLRKVVLESGGPRCFGKYRKVWRKQPEKCEECAFEYVCREDAGVGARLVRGEEADEKD